MPRQGLTGETIFQEAAHLIAEKGYDKFSLRELAARLGVRPPSLYSHVKNAAEISENVGKRAIAELSCVLETALRVSDRETAFRNFASAYRDFALKNPELYRAVIALPKTGDPYLKNMEQETIAPLRALVERFVSDRETVIAQQRFFRSALHGFVSLELNGFMRDPLISVLESFESLVSACLREIQRASDAEAEKKS